MLERYWRGTGEMSERRSGPYTGGRGSALATPFQINDIQLAHIPSLKFLMHIFTFLITFSN